MFIDTNTAAILKQVESPLNIIRLNMDSISQALKEAEAKSSVTAIYKELDKITALISGCALKAEEGCVVFLEDLLCDVIEQYHIKDNKRVEFIIKSSGDDVCVMGNPGKLCILFFNLLKNAVEAVEDKGTIVTEIDLAGDMARVRISDSGKGIDESLAAVIGRPFVSSKEDGRGLGLSISNGIAGEYGGSLTLENLPKGGCRATVRLKAYREGIAYTDNVAF